MVNAYNDGEAAVQDGPLTCLVDLMEDEDKMKVFTENQENFLGLLQVITLVGNQNAFF